MPEPQYVSFNSWEEMQAYLEANEAAANAHLVDTQKAITYGQLWVRFYDIADRVIIFGKVMELETVRAEEIRLGASAGEAAYTVKNVEERMARNYLFGRCWSVIEPDGELGDTHASQVWPCSPALYDEAHRVGWRIDDMDPWAKAELQTLHIEMFAAMRGPHQ
jgi:hypothetical protein